MVKKIISQHIITVYDDGSITTKTYKPRNREFDCPESIKQITEIILQAVTAISDLMETENFSDEDETGVPKHISHKCVTQAIADVAKDFHVSIPTVHTKITRYLNVEMEDFKYLCADYYRHLIMGEEENPKMVDFLIAIVSEKCKNDHEIAESVGCIDLMHEKILDAGHRPLGELSDF